MRFQVLNHFDRARFQPGIVAIEQSAVYPLGDDFFEIDHGADYFAFFDRLGEVRYYVVLDREIVAAVGAGILRQIPYQRGEATRPAWYLCDLKVHPNYLRQHLSLRLLRHAIPDQISQCSQGYAISMNDDRASNQLVRVLERFPLVQFRGVTTLGIYRLDAEQMRSIAPLIARHRGALSYRSLNGKKDLRLKSTGQFLPLLHVQWGAEPSEILNPQTGATHMFCAPIEDQLAIELCAIDIHPQAAASIISAGMESDWKFILTSDI